MALISRDIWFDWFINKSLSFNPSLISATSKVEDRCLFYLQFNSDYPQELTNLAPLAAPNNPPIQFWNWINIINFLDGKLSEKTFCSFYVTRISLISCSLNRVIIIYLIRLFLESFKLSIWLLTQLLPQQLPKWNRCFCCLIWHDIPLRQLRHLHRQIQIQY